MGKHSCDSCCDYTPYQQQISALTTAQATLQSNSQGITTQLNDTKGELDSTKQQLEQYKKDSSDVTAKLEKLAAVCMVDPQYQNLSDTDIQMLGQKIRGLMTTSYQENVKILDTQTKLIEKQTRILGMDEQKREQHKEELDKINQEITTHDREMKYDNDGFVLQDTVIKWLKVGATLIIIGIIIAVIISIIKKVISNIKNS